MWRDIHTVVCFGHNQQNEIALLTGGCLYLIIPRPSQWATFKFTFTYDVIPAQVNGTDGQSQSPDRTGGTFKKRRLPLRLSLLRAKWRGKPLIAWTGSRVARSSKWHWAGKVLRGVFDDNIIKQNDTCCGEMTSETETTPQWGDWWEKHNIDRGQIVLTLPCRQSLYMVSNMNWPMIIIRKKYIKCGAGFILHDMKIYFNFLSTDMTQVV